MIPRPPDLGRAPLVVCHDAGGAEVISSYVRRHGLQSAVAVLDGPAVEIFRRKLGLNPTRVSLERAVANADAILSGTGWSSDLEWSALRLGREAGVRTIAFLDHWHHYDKRFTRGGVRVVPDEIWVGDQHAFRIAREVFPDLSVLLVENPYLLDVQEAIAALPKPATVNGSLRVLFVTEPISEFVAAQSDGEPAGWGYDERTALRYFLEHLDRLGAPVAQVVIRPHPAECLDKYDWAQAFPKVRVARGPSLLDDINAADVVVGCESMAMVVALAAGRRVVCAIPPGGRRCSLPHDEIECLSTSTPRDRE